MPPSRSVSTNSSTTCGTGPRTSRKSTRSGRVKWTVSTVVATSRPRMDVVGGEHHVRRTACRTCTFSRIAGGRHQVGLGDHIDTASRGARITTVDGPSGRSLRPTPRSIGTAPVTRPRHRPRRTTSPARHQPGPDQKPGRRRRGYPGHTVQSSPATCGAVRAGSSTMIRPRASLMRPRPAYSPRILVVVSRGGVPTSAASWSWVRTTWGARLSGPAGWHGPPASRGGLRRRDVPCWVSARRSAATSLWLAFFGCVSRSAACRSSYT